MLLQWLRQCLIDNLVSLVLRSFGIHTLSFAGPGYIMLVLYVALKTTVCVKCCFCLIK